jgi:hypothetical protein
MSGHEPDSNKRFGFRFRTGGFEVALQIAAGIGFLLLLHFCSSP